MIQTGCIRNDTIAGDPSIGWLHADNPLVCGRLAHTVTGIRTNGKRNDSSRYKCCTAAAASSGNSAFIPGIVNWSCVRIAVGSAHAQLIHTGLCYYNCACSLQLINDMRIVYRDIIIQNTGGCRGTDSLRIHVVL